MFSNVKIPIIMTMHNYFYDDLIMKYGSLIGRLLCIFEKSVGDNRKFGNGECAYKRIE